MEVLPLDWIGQDGEADSDSIPAADPSEWNGMSVFANHGTLNFTWNHGQGVPVGTITVYFNFNNTATINVNSVDLSILQSLPSESALMVASCC